MKKKTIRQRKVRKMKKFRSQIISHWLVNTYAPCKVADIGGGKGLLSYLLNQSGYQSTVIDPLFQTLPDKYTDLNKKKILISSDMSVNRLTKEFSIDDVKDFDLLVGLHAHGCNMWILEAAVKYDIDFLILPCCVIDEPIVKQPDINWRESLKEYGLKLGLEVKEIQFNFKGKNIGLYTDRKLKKIGELNESDTKNFLIKPIRYEACLVGEGE